jgi:hypothetical protein
MTCSHVLDVIDAGPFADVPHEYLEAARQHAHDCANCGAALATSKALTAELTSLAQPAAPPDLAAAVMADIARLEQRYPVPAGRSSRKDPAGTRGWSAWTTAAGGVAGGLATVLSTPGGNAALSNIALLKVGVMAGGGVGTPPTTSVIVLGAALVLYAAGLFASISARRRS